MSALAIWMPAFAGMTALDDVVISSGSRRDAVKPKIVLVMPLFEADEGTRAMVPPGFELVVTGAGTPEYRAAIAEAEYLVGFVDMLIKDELYKSAPKLKLIQLLS